GVTDFTEKVKSLIEEINPSFFEITVGMAFDWFAQQQVDIAVIETGLGGRLDSTNVITPDLSVITNIGMDHMQLLGNTLAEIAAEKAGIIKEGVTVVVGESSSQTDEVFRSAAASKNAPLFFADKLWYASDWEQKDGRLVTDIIHKRDETRKTYLLDLPGYY